MLRAWLLLLTIIPGWGAVSLSVATPYVAPHQIVIGERFWAYTLGPQTGSQEYGMYAVWHMTAPCSFTGLKFVYGNYNTGNSGDSVGANSITITPSIDMFWGGYTARTVLKFSGSSPVTLTAGSFATSDVLYSGVWMPPTFEFRDLCFMNAGVSGTWPLSDKVGNSSAYENVQYGTSTADQSAGGINFHVAGYPYGACFAYATHHVPIACWLGIGDSVMEGFGDVNTQIPTAVYAYNKGWFERALAANCGVVDFACSGQTASAFASSGGSYRIASGVCSYCTHACMALCVNDFGIPHTVSQVQTDVATCVQKLRTAGINKVYVTTIQPNTSSTDSWATVGNQTVGANEANYVSYNSAIRSTNGANVGADGYFEVRTPCESSPGSGKWAVTGTANYATTDGLHPSPAINALIAAAIAPSMSLVP